MDDVTRRGRTIVFVSHNMEAISTLTSRCVVLSDGRSDFAGPTESAIARYLQRDSRSDGVYTAAARVGTPTITHVGVRTTDPGNMQRHGQPMEITVEITTPCAIRGARISVKVVDSRNRPVAYLWAYDSEKPMCREGGTHRLVFAIPHVHLYKGEYRLAVYCLEHFRGRTFEMLPSVCAFEVTMHGWQREGVWNPSEAAYIEDSTWRAAPVDGTP
jgi:lipopolysaccharide transport system ATP-binding protein